MLVALEFGSVSSAGLAWNGSGAWRHDNQRVCIPFGYGSVEAVLIVEAPSPVNEASGASN